MKKNNNNHKNIMTISLKCDPKKLKKKIHKNEPKNTMTKSQ